MTDLKAYFEITEGAGVLATADAAGKVDAAIYSRPHVMEDGSLAFIMLDRLTHRNLQSNPHAAYLFIQKGPGFQGIRLFLTKTREETDSNLIEKLRRRKHHRSENSDNKTRFLVYFNLDRMLPLVSETSEAGME